MTDGQTFEDRVALVTGAGQGVGAGIASRLAAAGATVAVNDVHADRAQAIADRITAAGGRARPAVADVTDLAAVETLVADVATAVGPVDILVNNAGIPTDGFVPRPFREMPVTEWDRFVRLNLYGVLHGVKATVDGMCDRGWGRIVTVSSEAGRMGLPSGISLYGASKAAAIGFSRHLALELVGTGVTANCVALGLMATGPDDARRPPWPTGRLGDPADVAAAVCFLASDDAEWITGQVLGVNGGALTT
ncbi:MAG TPA: SDR family NAD(P)-dependent oxidoreductase [Acidimicrobiia bacterium]|nr:SDR family NAD(P)-dependent oxidoreductase [Acidimicrobiia bacterium]